MSEDNQAEEIETSAPEPKPEPLFTLDLGANGGVLAPTSYADLQQWIRTEISFWDWTRVFFKDTNEALRWESLHESIDLLVNALNITKNAEKNGRFSLLYEKNKLDRKDIKELLERCQHSIVSAYVSYKIPHSSTPLGHRLKQVRQSAGDRAALVYVSMHLDPQVGQNDVLGHPAVEWRGLVEGLIDRFHLAGSSTNHQSQAAGSSFEQLRRKAEKLVADQSQVLNALHKDFSELIESTHLESRVQSEAHLARKTEFDELKSTHEQKLEALRKAFKTEIGMREPVEYWKTKRDIHQKWSKGWGGMSILGIAGAAGSLSWLIHDLLNKTPANTAPETWRLAVLALVAVFTVWGVRLIVRLFLSHQHLYTDAEERITMVQTYLSLMQGEHLASRSDRQLILQALFRPASDGLVKDEGVPFSLAEVITRQGKP